MKVTIICNNNLFLFPFLKKYLEILKKECEYTILYWDRNGNETNIEDSEKFISFDYPMNTYKSRIFKIKGYYKYRKFVINYLKNNKSDFIIVFNTQTALLINKMLKKNNYIFDYRDESFEKYSFYRKKVEAVINNSKYTIMSSLGFKKLFKNIKEEKILMLHNNKFNQIKKDIKNFEKQHISIAFWGMVRFTEYYKKILDLFGNKNKYIVNIYGEGYIGELISYCNNNQYKNINFFGKYNDKEIEVFAKNTDILLNCYPLNSTQKYSLTCKLYEGIVFRIPMIIEENSYMDEFLDSNNYPHFKLDFTKNNKEILEELEKWFEENKDISKASDNILNNINIDNENTMNKIKECFVK